MRFAASGKIGSMNPERYNRSLTLICSTCGGQQFEYDEGDGPVRCTGCDRVFARDELIRENGEQIDAEVDAVKREVVSDLRDHLRKALKGSKFISFK